MRKADAKGRNREELRYKVFGMAFGRRRQGCGVDI